MKSSKFFTLAHALGCAAFAISLAVCAQAQTFTDLSDFNGRNAYPPDATFVQIHFSVAASMRQFTRMFR